MSEEVEGLGEQQIKEEKGVIESKYDHEREVSVMITYNLDTEELTIDSGFETSSLIFKEPIEYTAQCLQMALEKWIRERIGLVCPNCGIEHEEDWDYCPKCGYSWLEKIESENDAK